MCEWAYIWTDLYKIFLKSIKTYASWLLRLPSVWELLGHDLNWWLSTRWQVMAKPVSSGASNACEQPELVDPGSLPSFMD